MDDPRHAAGNLDLSLDAWSGEDRDGSEPQREREARQAAAVDVCMGCPVMVQCDAYASSVTRDGKLAEPDGIWGGRLALERHREFIAKRHRVAAAAPVRQMQTPQKLRVLRALAAHEDAEAVAVAAGVDLRTANWQRSRLVTQLNLHKKKATRTQLLEAAVKRGLLEAAEVVSDDGSVPAVPPPTSATPAPAAAEPSAASLPAATVVQAEAAPHRVSRRRRPRRARGPAVSSVPGQLSFDDALALAPVTVLFPNARLEPAA
ncbi:WhiB family transcriptional regulator [Streptomyces sp. NPDC093269]|uniref:WhiB family transcriptional regulator n=1 Tax=Streptomyces sp. NPDC093269 TaxID=3366038 RepID=UPI0038243151